MDTTRKGILYAYVSLLLLGVMPVISNGRPAGISALDFALYLSVWQLLFSLPLFVNDSFTGQRGIFSADISKHRQHKTLAIIIVTGAIFGISTFVYVLAMEKAGAVSGAIAIEAYPLFAMLWEAIFLKKKKSPKELFFTFLLLLALYYLATAGSWRISGFSSWFALALVPPLLWSIAHLIIKLVLNNTPMTPGQITFFRSLVATLVLAVVAVAIDGWRDVWESAYLVFQFSAALMGVVYYAELIAWFYAVKYIDVSLAAAITTPAPVITLLFAVAFLSEPIHAYQIVAMGVVIASVYGVIYAGKKKTKPNTLMTHFLSVYTGRTHGVLRWEQLDALWQIVLENDDWFAYEIGAPLPSQPLDSAALAAFIEEANAFLRAEHEEKYCGVVYTDSFEQPSLLKIYHPKKMGASCGSSGSITLPRWTLSTSKPVNLLDWAAEKQQKPAWWKQMLKVR